MLSRWQWDSAGRPVTRGRAVCLHRGSQCAWWWTAGRSLLQRESLTGLAALSWGPVTRPRPHGSGPSPRPVPTSSTAKGTRKASTSSSSWRRSENATSCRFRGGRRDATRSLLEGGHADEVWAYLAPWSVATDSPRSARQRFTAWPTPPAGCAGRVLPPTSHQETPVHGLHLANG
jgi:hypothetical protein